VSCFRIGGDIRIVKVAEGDDTQTPLAGASFDVSCNTGEGATVPPVVISGLSGPATFADGAYVASGVATTGVIAIAGPEGTVCTVTETANGGADATTYAVARLRIPKPHIVAILGKGHESGQEIAGQVLPFRDTQVEAEE